MGLLRKLSLRCCPQAYNAVINKIYSLNIIYLQFLRNMYRMQIRNNNIRYRDEVIWLLECSASNLQAAVRSPAQYPPVCFLRNLAACIADVDMNLYSLHLHNLFQRDNVF